MNIRSKIIIFCTAILVILVGTCSYYYFAKLRPYNALLNSANQAVLSEDYDKAVTLYIKALNYKKSEDVSKKIELAKVLKKSKGSYDTAVKEMNDKKYLEAIDDFKKVDKQDSKRYETTQGKISECSKLCIADNLKNASDNLKNNKYDDANKCIDNILKLDANNTEAKKLKDDIAKAIQKQKNEIMTTEASTQGYIGNGSISFQQALQIVISSNEFKDYSKGTIKINDTKYKYPNGGYLELLTDDKSAKVDNTFGWDIVNGKNVYSIPVSIVNTNGVPHFKNGYLVEVSTGKLYRWDSGHAKEVN